jgi:hypothetical protein
MKAEENVSGVYVPSYQSYWRCLQSACNFFSIIEIPDLELYYRGNVFQKLVPSHRLNTY